LEGNETFQVAISGSTGFISDGVGLGSIIDDDSDIDNDNIPGGANQLLAKLQVWDRVNSMNIERRKNGEEPII
jgi:hypothetical protein